MLRGEIDIAGEVGRKDFLGLAARKQRLLVGVDGTADAGCDIGNIPARWGHVIHGGLSSDEAFNVAAKPAFTKY